MRHDDIVFKSNQIIQFGQHGHIDLGLDFDSVRILVKALNSDAILDCREPLPPLLPRRFRTFEGYIRPNQ